MASIALALAGFSFVPQTLEKISVLIVCLINSCPCKLNPFTHMVVYKPGTVIWLAHSWDQFLCLILHHPQRQLAAATLLWGQQGCSGHPCWGGMWAHSAAVGRDQKVLSVELTGVRRWATAAVLGRVHLISFFLGLNTISLSKKRISTHSEMWN